MFCRIADLGSFVSVDHRNELAWHFQFKIQFHEQSLSAKPNYSVALERCFVEVFNGAFGLTTLSHFVKVHTQRF